MTKDQAIEMIDLHKNKMINPVEMLHWTWLRVIILQIPEGDWDKYYDAAVEVLRR